MRKLAFIALLFCIMAGAQQTRPVLIIPVELNGVPFENTVEKLDSTLQTVSAYCRDNLNDKYPCEFVQAPTVRLTGSYNNDNIHIAVIDACRQLSKHINFAEYHNGVGLIFSGENIFPHENSIENLNASIVVNGISIRSYFATSEFINGKVLEAGLICHEYGHLLGLKDMYDTDGANSNGLSPGLWGSTALMDKGEQNGDYLCPAGLNAIDLKTLGIGVCDTLKPGNYNLQPLSREQRYLYLPCDVDDEYFLFECRSQEKWDSLIGGNGLLVYHIDQSYNKSGYSTFYKQNLNASERWEYNEVNCRPDHQCARLLKANPDAETVGDVFFPFADNRVLSSESSPALRFWSGKGSTLALLNIQIMDDSSVSFDVIEPIADAGEYCFQNEARLFWDIDPSLLDQIEDCTIYLNSNGEDRQEFKTMPNSKGRVSISFDSLRDNCIYDVELHIESLMGPFSSEKQFKTLVIDSRNTYPFIFLFDAKRDSRGNFLLGSSFPLHVFNAFDVEEIVWTFDGKTPQLNSDGLFVVERDGVLKAELHYSDGSCEVLCKSISVR